MSDVLSQNEVESLLAALDGDASASDFGGGGGQDPAPRTGGQISVYDFKRPERVSKEQMRAFQALHEGFSREFGAALSGMLRSIVEVRLISVDQLTYSEFVFSLENPTCFNLLESKGLEGNLILDLNPSIIFPVVDRLLGGGRHARLSNPNRALTEIELRLVSRITQLAMRGLEKAWSNLCSLDLHVTQVESNPQLVQIVPPNEVIVLISFEISMGDMRGIMNLCIPFNTIEPLSGKLSSDTWSAYTKRAADERQKLSLEKSVGKAKVKLAVQVAETTVTADEIAGLAVGDIILTQRDQSSGLEIYLEGRPMFRGSPGMLKGHKAIRVGERIRPAKELIAQQLGESDEPEKK
ncbi:flagellar motor switch protein FliM [Stratiformator vulcanicus]|uniref:Flagellar motor switch protein FliM n=1 Tax=Stratiformator vulcanicus TaxID=2527980 RepID=A0A517R5R4_9PLAN|nr:flagellar motor switch protein FliM [Stratiformator vulcanicus]QDT39212.1 Flagellar motor switch protein FliM [Stratiformator vulcanicus]